MNVFGIVLTLFAFVLPAHAERMNVDTHSIVIGKLEGALAQLPKSGSEYRSISVRLADLYADRARLLLLAQQDPKKDRNRAITLYGQVVNDLETSVQGPVLLQLGHLQNADGQTDQAIKNLNRATNGKLYELDITSRANAQLGEIRFRKAEFRKAEGHFKKALENDSIQNRGFLTYRLAWAQLNQGESAVATATLIRLLKTPDLLTVENQEGVVFDDSFHEDITRDLVVFLARGNVGDQEIEQLIDLTPEKLRKENLYSFATELERLGKKYSATLAWRAYYAEGDNSPYEMLETQIRVAQLQWDMGRKAEALEEYAKAIELWRKKGCKVEKCSELQKRYKNFVITWNRVEKDKPSARCLSAYKYYLSAFDQDPEMYYKAATVADLNKNHKEAALLYAQTAALTAELVRKGKPVNKELLEASLMQQIESAELTKDKNSRLNAYNTYLELNPKGQKAVEVRYQKAHVIYEMGQFDQAFQEFKEIAFEKPEDQRALRVKAADLALDSLAAQKKDQEIFEWAPKFAKVYPERNAEFAKVQRQAVILMATRILDKKDASHSALRKELDKLKAMDLKLASKDEQLLILKNRIAIAVRIQDLNEITLASQGILNVKGTTEKDRDSAYKNLAWVAELKLDFKSALKYTKKIENDQMAEDDRHLRFAMLTELAGQDATQHYKRALKATDSKDKALSIRATLVRRAKRPWPVLKEHAPQLSRNSTLLSTLLVEVYSKDGNDQKAKSFIRQYGLNNSSLAKLFQRQDFFARWKIEDRKLSQHNLYVRSDALLQKTITERIAKLNRQDYLGREALKMADWGAQLAVLTTVSRENMRLYNDLMKLPAPRRLKAPEKAQYLAILKAKAEPFRIRANEAGQKLKEFHDNDRAVDEMAIAIRNSKGRVRDLLAKDAKVIGRLASFSQKRELESAVEASQSRPSTADIARARTRLAKDPFDAGVAQDLKKLAERRGETTMVAFLDARIQQLKKGVQ